MERTIVHVDMDAFFASVELLSRPHLAGKPLVVAGKSERGVVAAATYEARAFGVRSGMSVIRARALCPAAIWIEPNHREYRRVSGAVMELLGSVTPVMEVVSIDEAFLDLTSSLRALGPARQIVQQLRATVRQRCGITCSAGIGRSKSVAKIASKLAKPNGLREVKPDQTLEFLRPLPVNSLWGIGPKTKSALDRLGITTVAELADSRDAMIIKAVGEMAGRHLLALARGQDDAPVLQRQAEKSIGAETTFEHDLPRAAELRRAVARLADKAAWRLRDARLVCRTVSIKLRSAEFVTLSRSHTLAAPTDETRRITEVAQMLVEQADPKVRMVRLVGVRLENLVPRSGAPVQVAFDQVDGSDRRIDAVRDQVRRRFGDGALGAGSLLS
jgi:DNA polymerase-4